jgi:hypothetical protein
MANIEQVKERFKNAKEVRCVHNFEIYNIDVDGTFESVGGKIKLFKFKTQQRGSDFVILYGYNNLKDTCGYAEIISYNKDVSEPEKSEYPKVMLVSDNESSWKQRVVFMEKKKIFIAWAAAETIEEAIEILSTTHWKYAKELPKEIEVTKEEIAKWKGCEVEQLVIK